jgi:hypothetical protein
MLYRLLALLPLWLLIVLSSAALAGPTTSVPP